MDINKFMDILSEYIRLDLDSQIDYSKFYLYSLITHSTAIEGSTITELENTELFDHDLSPKGKSMNEIKMNLDLKDAYQRAFELAKQHTPISVGVLKHLSSYVMKNTGSVISNLQGSYDVSRGDLRLSQVTAGPGGRFYMDFRKVPEQLKLLCQQLNERRNKLLEQNNVIEEYKLSFDAHERLVTIHPWADGNGRMSRLLMNYIQYEFGIPLAKVLKEDRVDYITALNESRDSNNPEPFRMFMFNEHGTNLQNEIINYRQSIGDDVSNGCHLHR